MGFYSIHLYPNSNPHEPIAGALILLITIPFLLILKKEKLAEITVIGVYYLLVAGVVAQLD